MPDMPDQSKLFKSPFQLDAKMKAPSPSTDANQAIHGNAPGQPMQGQGPGGGAVPGYPQGPQPYGNGFVAGQNPGRATGNLQGHGQMSPAPMRPPTGDLYPQTPPPMRRPAPATRPLNGNGFAEMPPAMQQAQWPPTGNLASNIPPAMQAAMQHTQRPPTGNLAPPQLPQQRPATGNLQPGMNAAIYPGQRPPTGSLPNGPRPPSGSLPNGPVPPFPPGPVGGNMPPWMQQSIQQQQGQPKQKWNIPGMSLLQPSRQSYNHNDQHLPRYRQMIHRLPGYHKVKKLQAEAQYSLKARIILFLLVLSILTPTFFTLAEGVNAVILYSHARGGIQHLLNIKDIFTGSQDHAKGFMDIAKLQQAEKEFQAANADFQQISVMLDGDPLIGTMGIILPDQISSARALSKIGIDVTDMGQQLVQTSSKYATTFRNGLLAQSKQPLVTKPMLEDLRKSILYALPRLNDIQQQTHGLHMDSLPLNDKQRQQFNLLVQVLPEATNDLKLASNLMDAIGWILGVDAPRNILLLTMDRAELRPAGGFTGQFGELNLNAGRMSPFQLQNIQPYEEDGTNSIFINKVQGQQAPAPYNTWWPIANFGLRDANLSADFPTSAKLAMHLYNYEFGKNVDGVIAFSPFLISRILDVTGPIKVPQYNETITAQNLEDKLHYYQLDNEGIGKEIIIEKIKVVNGDTQTAGIEARKLFTKHLAQLLMDHIRTAPPDEILALGREMLRSLQTRDLQLYVNNTQIENLLQQYNANSIIDTSNKHDGLFVVQGNFSASKATQYIRTIMHDTVTLDEHGGATHTLQLRLVYNQIASTYGLDTYRDYVRIYVPDNSQFLDGNGFATNEAYCGAGGAGPCTSPDLYGDGTLTCLSGINNAGYATNMINDPFAGNVHPIPVVGAPKTDSSDFSGRAMYAGWLVVPKNCTLTATVRWYVPPSPQDNGYQLLVQRQASTYNELDLTIVPPPSTCRQYASPAFYYNGVLSGQDMLFSLKRSDPNQHTRGGNCYPQLPV